MENQHKHIRGYREFNVNELEAINRIKDSEADTARLVEGIKQVPGVDQRQLSIAVTEFEHAYMRLVRSVAKPENPFGR